MSTTSTTVKRTTRKKEATIDTSSEEKIPAVRSPKEVKPQENSFNGLIAVIQEAKDEFIALQKTIFETREEWEKEQQKHQQVAREQLEEEKIARKREQEFYEYETAKRRREDEDTFTQKKIKWERELAESKEIIEKERQELETLRKQVDGFETEKEKAIKDAIVQIQKTLTDAFANEKKLREQETKAEKELLNLRITNMTQDNTRQTNEIAALKKALEEASTQLKDVAVKVIESSATSNAERPRVATQE